MALRKLISFLLGLTLIAAMALPASAQHRKSVEPCDAEFDAAIEKLGIDRAKITQTRSETTLTGRNAKNVSGHLMWLSSNACEGSVVIQLQPSCQFIDTFSRGKCTLDALKK